MELLLLILLLPSICVAAIGLLPILVVLFLGFLGYCYFGEDGTTDVASTTFNLEDYRDHQLSNVMTATGPSHIDDPRFATRVKVMISDFNEDGTIGDDHAHGAWHFATITEGPSERLTVTGWRLVGKMYDGGRFIHSSYTWKPAAKFSYWVNPESHDPYGIDKELYFPSPSTPSTFERDDTIMRRDPTPTQLRQINQARRAHYERRDAKRDFYQRELERLSSTPAVAENGDLYNFDNDGDGRPEPTFVNGYHRSDGTYVRSHYRAKPTRHYVNGYFRKDGTYVSGHWRGGN